MKDLGTSGSPGGEEPGKSASCPCLTAEALLSLFFHCLQQEPFHNDLPTVISLLKAVALGSRQEVGCVSSSLWLLVLCVRICLHWGQSPP